jgi:hypothetical protein
MPDPGFARDLDTIDTELGSIAALNRDANCQLASVRRQICEMQAQELNLIAAVDARHRRADRLLDERLHAATAEALVNG